jgi:hypothetical protein
VKARVLVGCGLLLAAALAGGCGRRDAATAEQLQKDIDALQKERDALRSRLGELMVKDARLQGMPDSSVRVGVPTSLARTLIERVLAGVADQVTLRLGNLKARKEGTVKKIVTVGTYVLEVTVVDVTGKLQAGKPDLQFGGNQVAVTLPVTVASGTGRADVRFKWDGKNVSGAVCGDMDVTRQVTGAVKPMTHTARGSLALATAGGQILARPRFPETRVRLEVEPSKESWASIQALLDEKGGVCGFVLDKVDIPQVIRENLGKGFSVKLPVEKLKPVAVPVGIQQQVEVGDRTLTLDVAVGGLAITEHSIWLGAHVRVGAAAPGAKGQAPPPAQAPAKPTAKATAKPTAKPTATR